MTVAIADLRTIDLLADIGDEQLAAWADAAEEAWYEPGQDLVRYGDPVMSFRLLFEGALDVFLLLDGREERDHVHTAPTWLGAMLAVTGEPSNVTVRAAERSRVASIAPEAFRELLFRTPLAFQRVMRAFRPVLARIESHGLQREKLAALGRMSAGLAHELNNPAAAAKRTAAALGDALDVLGGVIGTFVESGIERAEAEALVALQRQALARACTLEPRAGLAAADAEDAMGERLEARGVPDAWQLAEPLAAAGVDDAWLDEVERLAGPAFGAAVRWVATSVTARVLADDLRETTDRMSGLVSAIKAYTYMDRADLQEIDVHEGLDATLTILGHKLKHTRIAVERRYAPDLPRVCVYGSELNQVWTNLLDNAIDALGETGTITIATAAGDDGGVEVTIADDGPGIPEAVQPQVFEPFYTTKAVGAGTGLGLDTTLRIVRDHHDGDLRLRSRPGETTFTVRLPRKPQRTGAAQARA